MEVLGAIISSTFNRFVPRIKRGYFMNKKILVILSWLLLPSAFYGQDTLTVLQYNILNYGYFSSYCPENVNSPALKDGYIKTIVDYIKPDIFTVVEMGQWQKYHNEVLDNCLNVNGVSKYKRAVISNTAGSSLVNMLYYNSDKLALKGVKVLQNLVRDIDLFQLYYKDEGLIQGDTIWINCIVAHLKAGSGYYNEVDRESMVQNALSTLRNYYSPSNYLFMGDFNLYGSYEGAWTKLTTAFAPDWAFNDPINRVGDWSNNSSFSDVHSQSTHTDGGCFSSGGGDDRFDFILATSPIIDGSEKVKYIPGSYRTVGQDGLHFNRSLIDNPMNTTVPSDVLLSLYNNSDHMPVSLKLKISTVTGMDAHNTISDMAVEQHQDGPVRVKLNLATPQKVVAECFSIDGRVLDRKVIEAQQSIVNFEFASFRIVPGVVIVKITPYGGSPVSKKVFVGF